MYNQMSVLILGNSCRNLALPVHRYNHDGRTAEMHEHARLHSNSTGRPANGIFRFGDADHLVCASRLQLRFYDTQDSLGFPQILSQSYGAWIRLSTVDSKDLGSNST